MANSALVHCLPISDYMLLAFKNPKRAQVTTSGISIIVIKKCGLKKQIAQVPSNKEKRNIYALF